MRILLVGNYPQDRQASMLRYAEMLEEMMDLHCHEVEILQPRAVLGKLLPGSAAGKWLGYVDKYVLFPAKLRRVARNFDGVHVCDQSNSMYLAHVGGCRASITCHDLLAMFSAQGKYPEQRVSFTGKILQSWIRKHVARASFVVCVSSKTAEELTSLRDGAGADKVERTVAIIPNAVRFPSKPAREEDVCGLRRTLGLAPEEQYLLHIGGDHWYKNRPGAVRIFGEVVQRLRARGITPPRLVMAGAPLSLRLREWIQEKRLEWAVIELGSPSDEQLRMLYTGAAALLFPSLYEGFGWPLIEAQSCGCPVITSNRAPMTEIAGDAALYIDPADEAAAADRIADCFERLPLLKEAGVRNVKRFEVDRIAPEYERFFRAVAEETASCVAVE